MSRLERAAAELTQALANYMAAVSAELATARATVAPHSHAESRPSGVSSLSEYMTAAAQPQIIAPSEKPESIVEIAAALPPTAPAPPTVSKPTTLPKALVFTPERMAIIERDYPAGVPIAEIFERLAPLPGAPLTDVRRIAIAAAARGWRRPAPQTVKPSPGVAPAEAVKLHPSPPAKAPPAKPSPKPVAAAPIPAQIDQNCWTPKRLELAQSMYEAGAPLLDIAVAANALNGPIITIPKIQVVAAARGWPRGTPQPASSVPIVAEDVEIRHWAGQRGIAVQSRALPLEQINAKRAQLGMAPFVLATRPRGRVA